MLLDDIINSLSSLAGEFKLNKFKELRSLYMKFDVKYEREVRNIVFNSVSKYIRDGEVIELIVKDGIFIDTGMETLRVKKGFVWEFYYYPKMVHYFIRQFYIINDREWIALYIDENPLSPWWSEEERIGSE